MPRNHDAHRHLPPTIRSQLSLPLVRVRVGVRGGVRVRDGVRVRVRIGRSARVRVWVITSIGVRAIVTR